MHLIVLFELIHLLWFVVCMVGFVFCRELGLAFVVSRFSEWKAMNSSPAVLKIKMLFEKSI